MTTDRSGSGADAIRAHEHRRSSRSVRSFFCEVFTTVGAIGAFLAPGQGSGTQRVVNMLDLARDLPKAATQYPVISR